MKEFIGSSLLLKPQSETNLIVFRMGNERFAMQS